MNYSTYRRLENELRAVARQHGYNGTLFLRDTPPLGAKVLYRVEELERYAADNEH